MNKFALLTDGELSDVFNQGVPFTVHKHIVKGGMDMTFFIVPDSVFPFVSNNYPKEGDGLSSNLGRYV